MGILVWLYWSLLQEAEIADVSVELQTKEKDSKWRKILTNVKFALRSSFRKCGCKRLVGPVHEESIFYKWLCLRLEMMV